MAKQQPKPPVKRPGPPPLSDRAGDGSLGPAFPPRTPKGPKR